MYDFFSGICGLTILALIIVYIAKYTIKKSGGNVDLLINIRNICFVIMAVSVLGGIITSPSWSDDSSKSKTSVKTTKTPSTSDTETIEQVEVLHPEIQKVSVVPSIGATRAEFERYHKETAHNSVGNICYDNDSYIVQFFDSEGNESSDKNNRAFMVTIQPLSENNYLAGVNLNDFIPSDAQNLQKDNTGSDNMVLVTHIKGSSPALAQIYPKSNGNFEFGINQDKKTGKFLGGTISVDF